MSLLDVGGGMDLRYIAIGFEKYEPTAIPSL